MARGALPSLPSWVFPVLMGVSGLAGWYLMSRVLRVEGPLNLGLHALMFVLALSAFVCCGVSAWMWLGHRRTKDDRQD
jgi:hypothetical protein